MQRDAPKRRRGRPSIIPAETIVAARGSLARGIDVATVARMYGLSRRYVRDLLAGVRRPGEVEIPPELVAVEGDLGADLRELYAAIKLAEIKLAR